MSPEAVEAHRRLYQAARPLRRCRVRVKRKGEHLIVQVVGGKVKAWTDFWEALAAVERVVDGPQGPPRKILLV